MPLSGNPAQGQSRPSGELAAVVEATDIPILSATDRLQRALLRWVDLCGISGRYEFRGAVAEALESLSLLDERAYVLGIVGSKPADWPIIWAGPAVMIEAGSEFQPSMQERVGDARFLHLLAQEYADAVRYRRAAARRFRMRSVNREDAVDQLIFPLRDNASFDYVLVQGELVSGALLYSVTSGTQDSVIQ